MDTDSAYQRPRLGWRRHRPRRHRTHWTGGRRGGQLLISRCQDCGHYFHPPAPACWRCRSTDVAPEPVSGRATVASSHRQSPTMDSWARTALHRRDGGARGRTRCPPDLQRGRRIDGRHPGRPSGRGLVSSRIGRTCPATRTPASGFRCSGPLSNFEPSRRPFEMKVRQFVHDLLSARHLAVCRIGCRRKVAATPTNSIMSRNCSAGETCVVPPTRRIRRQAPPLSFARVMGPPFSHGVGTTCLAQWG